MNRKKLIITAAALATVLTLFGIYQSVTFRITGVSPSLSGRVPSSTATVTIRFNKPLATDTTYEKNIEDPGKLFKSISVNGKDIVLRTRQFIEGKHSFSIKDISSASGQRIDRKDFNFTIVYVPFDQLTDDQKQAQLNATDSGNQEDPIAKHLPYGGEHFYLIASYTTTAESEEIDESSTESAGQIKLLLKATLFLSNADIRTDRNAAINTYKEEVASYIRSRGLDPANYEIRYEISDPL